jgi:hypothetical protein
MQACITYIDTHMFIAVIYTKYFNFKNKIGYNTI